MSPSILSAIPTSVNSVKQLKQIQILDVWKQIQILDLEWADQWKFWESEKSFITFS